VSASSCSRKGNSAHFFFLSPSNLLSLLNGAPLYSNSPHLSPLYSTSPPAVEVIGYAFRLYSHSDVAARSPYIGQLATLVIAPTFFSAALCRFHSLIAPPRIRLIEPPVAYIDWCLGLIIGIVSPKKSLISAKWFKITFVVADVVSLVIQAIGGGSAGSAGDDVQKLRTGSECVLLGPLSLPSLLLMYTFASMSVVSCSLVLVSSLLLPRDSLRGQSNDSPFAFLCILRQLSN